jgi:hypothetical protein
MKIESRLAILIDHSLEGEKHKKNIKLKEECLTYVFFERRDAKRMP